MIKKIWEYILLLCFAGYLYVCLELLFRGRSDVSMLFVATACSIPVIFLNNIFNYEMDFLLQIIVCTLTTTTIEYIAGQFFINKDHQIWDYSNMPFNLNGQICLRFMLVWMILSAIVIPLFDYLEFQVFNGTRPYYRILGYTFWMKDKKDNVITRKRGDIYGRN